MFQSRNIYSVIKVLKKRKQRRKRWMLLIDVKKVAGWILGSGSHNEKRKNLIRRRKGWLIFPHPQVRVFFSKLTATATLLALALRAHCSQAQEGELVEGVIGRAGLFTAKGEVHSANLVPAHQIGGPNDFHESAYYAWSLLSL